MRSKILFAVMSLALAGGSSEVFATACSASAGAITTSPSTVNGNTCTATDQLVASCGDTTPIGNAKDSIYSVGLGATNSATFSVNGTGFAPYVALMSGPACNSLNGCGAFENQGAAGTGVAVGPTANAAAGTYFLLITDGTGSAAACGTFAITVSGVLPVSLQNFSVE